MLKNLFIAGAVAGLLTGCASAPKLELGGGETLFTAEKVYTLTNLHPDDVRSRLYSINYQQPGLIPRCTEVNLLDISRKKLIFEAGDVKYHYIFHKASGSFDENIKKYFGTECSPKKLSALDKKGLREGKVFKGMSKDGVVLAIGYPPVHVTPSLSSNTWKYWSNRFNTFNVVFDKAGKVKTIQD